MHAMIFEHAHEPLRLETDMAVPKPGAQEVLIKVHACGVCRTDLHVVDGELGHPVLPLVPGHEIVGTVWKPGRMSPPSRWVTASAFRGSDGRVEHVHIAKAGAKTYANALVLPGIRSSEDTRNLPSPTTS